ncbi:crossover junction endonuclease mus81 [Nannizzia gypsea CBS 118893]|uniref:Crossover junction endonuclease MUS81 n=1 Tax=Arthroderma gypseum (strain ATCC MYA-4604 / CBS 118893) TaxID=535722 RepID=E5R1V1_ARTGP|nr:crossover junction endonuclease mus81 [Nannizzia gypsea CBS 118893]EFQ98585.1 crossover junction endonuclease mus81 [Nannizzia gypsea CBS 118893]
MEIDTHEMAEGTCANPLLLGWLKEWYDEAMDKNMKGPCAVYKKAYNSMKACPLKFKHPSEAQQLSGVGPKMCERLTAKLKEYYEKRGLPMPEPQQQAKKRPSTDVLQQNDDQPTKRPKKVKPYVPTLRSGPYALLLGLASLDKSSSVGLTKDQLIEVAQPHADASFTAPPDPNKFHTAWDSMKTLIRKDLVYERGRPLRRYLLTDEGWEIASQIQKTVRGSSHISSDARTSMDNFIHSGSTKPSSSRQLNSVEETILVDVPHMSRGTAHGSRFTLPHDSFTIEMVLDYREIRSRQDRDYISNELVKRGISPIVRPLEVGDIQWVAKCKDPHFLAQYGELGDEVALDWIVERKRLSDLLSSIKDGRFYEQKFRLRRSGIKNVIYLVEIMTLTSANPVTASRDMSAIASAIASTQVVNGYFVKQTNSVDESIRYLAKMTKLLREMYIGSESTTPVRRIEVTPTSCIESQNAYLLHLEQLRAEEQKRLDTSPTSSTVETTYTLTYNTFSALSSKSDMLTLRDIFLKMLMCTRGVTGDKALEIQRRWSTPREFVKAFEQAGPRGQDGKPSLAQDDLVASELGGFVGRKKIGKALSKKIAEIWAP